MTYCILCLKRCYKTTAICRQTSWPVCGEGDKSETVIFSLCPSCLLCAVLCRSRLGQCFGGGGSPAPPRRRTCSQSVSHSASLMNCDHQASSSPWCLTTQTNKHIVPALDSINNGVTKSHVWKRSCDYSKAVSWYDKRRFLKRVMETALTGATFLHQVTQTCSYFSFHLHSRRWCETNKGG